ncbi:MAG: hypothetical protein JSV35_06840 [Candidatus Bathyarchaeota archaeon]|nr:MAG: hypothetical protein JSV35_06840 [Candidatus Bathyarchaeota archaeon]
MVLPAKIFEIREKVDLGLIVSKLKHFREEEIYRTENGEAITLTTEILDLELGDDSISGVFSKDFIRQRFYKRELIEAPTTEESHFWIRQHSDRFFLIVSAPSVARGVKKLLTNFVANRLSRILFIIRQGIAEINIPHSTLQELHESNPMATKLIWFDDVDIPGVEKLCLAGSDLVDTTLYQEYLNHGKIWYVVFEVQRRGMVVGITRNCVVTLFSKSSTEDFINFISEDLLALIE